MELNGKAENEHSTSRMRGLCSNAIQRNTAALSCTNPQCTVYSTYNSPDPPIDPALSPDPPIDPALSQQVLKHELQQLGLPKEHSDALGRPYREQREALRGYFSETSFRLTQLNKVDWRVSLVLGHEGAPTLEASV